MNGGWFTTGFAEDDSCGGAPQETVKGLPVKKDVTTKTIDPYFAAYIQDVPWPFWNFSELRNSVEVPIYRFGLEVLKLCITPVAGACFGHFNLFELMLAGLIW